jgi:hypothetical protein
MNESTMDEIIAITPNSTENHESTAVMNQILQPPIYLSMLQVISSCRRLLWHDIPCRNAVENWMTINTLSCPRSFQAEGRKRKRVATVWPWDFCSCICSCIVPEVAPDNLW